MPRMRFSLILFLVALMAVLGLPAAAQADTPSVTVTDQFVTDTIYIQDVVSPGQGFVVIHTDSSGSPGPVAGFAPVVAGRTPGLWITLDPTMAAPTPVLYAMLHEDTGAVGTYEFGTVDGADLPVSVDGQIVTPAFNVAIINGAPQFVTDNTFTVASVTTPEDGWLVIHSEQNGGPGPVLGQTQISAGTSANVSVSLSGTTNNVWPMLHFDTGQIGVYEFGTVDGADLPVIVNGTVATTPLATVSSIDADPQPLIKGDGQPASTGAFIFHAHSVLSPGPGWLVIHADNNGQPGAVVGQTQVNEGLNLEVDVTVNSDGLPTVVWPMLHVDDGTVGTYEFDGSSGLDNPVSVDGQVVTFPVNIAPSLTLSDQAGTVAGGQISFTIDQAVIDQPGWIAIHSSADGSPGPVIGNVPLVPNFARNISVTVDAAAAGAQVFPMLHYDTGAAGVYEFGTVDGADLPVAVGGSVVVAPLNLTGAAAAPEVPEAPAATEQAAEVITTGPCTVTPGGSIPVNIRTTANVDSARLGQLPVGSTEVIDGQAPVGSFIWFRLASGGWVRSDVVITSGDCSTVPTVEVGAAEAPAAPPVEVVPPPVETPETGG